MHQLQLTGGERQDAADVVSDAQGEQGDDHQQQQDPPEAQVLHKLLPSGPEAGQHPLAALKVGVQERVALHGTATRRASMKQQQRHNELAHSTLFHAYLSLSAICMVSILEWGPRLKPFTSCSSNPSRRRMASLLTPRLFASTSGVEPLWLL